MGSVMKETDSDGFRPVVWSPPLGDLCHHQQKLPSKFMLLITAVNLEATNMTRESKVLTVKYRRWQAKHWSFHIIQEETSLGRRKCVQFSWFLQDPDLIGIFPLFLSHCSCDIMKSVQPWCKKRTLMGFSEMKTKCQTNLYWSHLDCECIRSWLKWDLGS